MKTTTQETNKTMRISAKNLGSLAMPDSCQRCFWVKSKLENKLPYQIFPGIFSSIDSYSKKITNLHHAKFGQVPSWLDGFGKLGIPLPVPHHTKFKMVHSQTGITLSGVPDGLIKGEQGIFIVDYKTARFTDTQDALLPMYKAQLNGYAMICEAIGMGQVSGMGLVYYEPETDITADGLEPLLLADGFKMGFRAKLLPIERDELLVPGLLERAKEINEMVQPPESKVDCRDCLAVKQMLDCLGEGMDAGEEWKKCA
jgi:hypothetical protein